MPMRDEDFGTPVTLAEADGGLRSPSMAAPASEPRNWQSLYEEARARSERARADAAEVRAEALL